jgi:hypothetical protein
MIFHECRSKAIHEDSLFIRLGVEVQTYEIWTDNNLIVSMYIIYFLDIDLDIDNLGYGYKYRLNNLTDIVYGSDIRRI